MEEMEAGVEVEARSPRPDVVEHPPTFDRFFAEQYVRLLRASFVLTGNHQEAEELTQEAFLSVWERWDRVAVMTDPVGYLARFRNRGGRQDPRCATCNGPIVDFAGSRRIEGGAGPVMEPDELERRLEHLGERISPRGDPLEGLERRMRRRQRARKAGTLALAMFIALVGLSAVSIAFIGGSGVRPGTSGTSAWVPPVVPTLWPENWTDPNAVSGEEAAQRSVEIGDQVTSWRTDPRSVGRRFVLLELGWVGVDVVHVTRIQGSASVPGGIGFVVSCGPRCVAGPATLDLVQPQRRGVGGIWSVASVVDTRVRIAIDDTRAADGDTVTASAGGSIARVVLSMGEGFAGRGGFVSFDGCTKTEAPSPPMGPPGGHWDTGIPPTSAATAPQPGGCGATASAYLFGYVKSGEMGPGSGKLFDQRNEILYHFSAIPILVTAPQAPQASQAASVGASRSDRGWQVAAVTALALCLLALALVRVRKRSRST